MHDTTERSTSGKTWIAILLILAIFYLPEIVFARPGYERFTNENTIGANDDLRNFAKFEDNEDVARWMNEESLSTTKERHKRLSDQRRAELETLMALSKMSGKLMNVTRGGRQLNTTKTGRWKRSILDMNIKNLRKLFRLSGRLGYKGNAAYPVVS